VGTQFQEIKELQFFMMRNLSPEQVEQLKQEFQASLPQEVKEAPKDMDEG
jgi:hypothetical protein